MISRYNFTKEDVYGHFEENKEDYDLISVSVICLNDERKDSDNKLIKMLSVLLSGRISSEEKKRILSEEFNIPMTKELEGGVNNMCNLSQGVYEDGYDSGQKKAVTASIITLMKNTDWDIEKCMDNLDIPENIKDIYRKEITNNLNPA